MISVGYRTPRKLVVLVRHGEAMSEAQDPARPLTEKGRHQAGLTGEWFDRLNVQLDVIWHSTKLRAKQTAELIAGKLRAKPALEQIEGLEPVAEVAPIAEKIEAERRERIMIVGHLPFLARLVGHMTTGDSKAEFAAFDEAGLAILAQVVDSWEIWCLIQPAWTA